MASGSIVVTRSLFNALTNDEILGIIRVKKDMTITFANTRAERIFGYVDGELSDRKFDILIPDDRREIHKKHFADFFNNPSTRVMGVGRNVEGLKRDGTLFKVEIIVSVYAEELSPDERFGIAKIREII